MGNAYSKPIVQDTVLIYKISSELTDLIYVGSTTQKLNRRLSFHKSDYKRFLDGKYHTVTSFKIFELDPNCSIELIEECEEENRDERERYHIENTLNCVNHNLPGRTRAEWHLDNAEHKAQYRTDNKGKKNKKHTCLCGGRYEHGSRARHFKSQIHQDYLNNQILVEIPTEG